MTFQPIETSFPQLYECSECGALVDQYRRTRHEDWHAELNRRA